jgi:dephospho-CoA kinase
MIRLGLTGSIGMGKSTVAAMFAAEGVPLFDADAAVHRLQGPDGALVAAIEAAFPGTTGPEGVNRGALAERVLAEPEQLRRLEALVHPAVAREREAFLAAHQDAPLVVLDIPLLFETGSARQVDKIAVVSAPADVQRERVLARPGMTAAKIERILARQLPDEEKRARADFVIPTGCSFGETRASVRRIIACLTGAADS